MVNRLRDRNNNSINGEGTTAEPHTPSHLHRDWLAPPESGRFALDTLTWPHHMTTIAAYKEVRCGEATGFAGTAAIAA